MRRSSLFTIASARPWECTSATMKGAVTTTVWRDPSNPMAAMILNSWRITFWVLAKTIARQPGSKRPPIRSALRSHSIARPVFIDRYFKIGQFGESDERRLRRSLAEALGKAGRGAEAALEYLRAAGEGQDEEAFRLRERAAYQFCVSGLIDDGRRTFAGVLKHLRLESSVIAPRGSDRTPAAAPLADGSRAALPTHRKRAKSRDKI